MRQKRLQGQRIMKEIDFLPEWYRVGRKRQVSYKRQYVVIICVVVWMIVWSVSTNQTISKAQAEHEQMLIENSKGMRVINNVNMLRENIERLRSGEQLLDKLKPRFATSNVIAELSFVLKRKVVLREVLISEEIFTGGANKSRGSGVSVRSAKGSGSKMDFLGESIRHKVVLAGVAADAEEVAKLVCNLEESDYFCEVTPSFSRNKEIDNYNSSEFEISCYIANYIER